MEPAHREAREKLVERRRALARLYGVSRSEEKDLREAPSPDWVDQAAGNETVDLLARLSDRERLELAEIDAALQRMEAGTYGTCESCGEPMGRERLRAVPEARVCVACGSA